MIVSLCKTYWMFSVQVSRELKDLRFTLYLVRYQLKNHRVSILTAKRENMGCKKPKPLPAGSIRNLDESIVSRYYSLEL